MKFVIPLIIMLMIFKSKAGIHELCKEFVQAIVTCKLIKNQMKPY